MNFDQKKEKIKEASFKCFAQYGYYKTTMEDIAKVMGMKKNSLYYYFTNKEALFHELINSDEDEYLKQLHSVLDEKLDTQNKILRIVELELNLLRDSSSKYSIRLDKFIEIFKVIRKKFPAMPEKKYKVVEAILLEAQAKNELFSNNITIVAKDIADIPIVLFNHHCLDPDTEFIHEIDFNSVLESAKRMAEYILRSIKSKTTV